MLTVAIPTWNNKNIIWLPMEGLARQKTERDWELIVMECFSTDIIGETYFREFYQERLKDAGCVRLKYIYSDDRLPLSAKWREMGRQARGRHFLLQGSDDYPHPERIQQTWEADADWFDIQRYWHYDFHKLILFNSHCTKPNIHYMAGECMAIRTKLLRNMPKHDVSSSVDHFLMWNCGVKQRYIDTGPHAGISTTGMNTISINRSYYFRNVVEPFYPTEQTIDTIGLPPEIIKRLT